MLPASRDPPVQRGGVEGSLPAQKDIGSVEVGNGQKTHHCREVGRRKSQNKNENENENKSGTNNIKLYKMFKLSN